MFSKKEEPKQSVKEYEQQGLEKYSYELEQETLEEAAERILANNIDGLRDALQDDDLFFFYKGVIKCYGEAMVEWQAERMYSELSVRLLCHNILMKIEPNYNYNELEKILDKQFKKK
jgi:hypothetical protein